MTKLMSVNALKALYEARPPVEDFGPQARIPYIVIQASDTGTVEPPVGRWLACLPCPIIGLAPGKSHGSEIGVSRWCDTLVFTERDLARILRNIAHAPFAAMILVQHLRNIEGRPLKEALIAESFAYGTVQTGPEYQKWLKDRTSPALLLSSPMPAVVSELHDTTLSISLNHAQTHNTIGVQMRDALCEALDMAQAIPFLKEITIEANGRCFSVGGAIEEFGLAPDGTTAHWVRSLRLPAHRLALLREQVSIRIHVNGAAIGAGAEMAAFGTHVTASHAAWFHLPELNYGLIPGAGGIAGMMARIGRHRTAYMALSMKRIKAQTALSWGLVDELVA